MRPKALFAVLLISLAAACAKPEATVPDISGTYRVNGTSPTGVSYSGKIVLTKASSNEYDLEWSLLEEDFITGTGTFDGNTLNVTWQEPSTSASGKATFVRHDDGSLVGTYTVDGTEGEGKETLIPQ